MNFGNGNIKGGTDPFKFWVIDDFLPQEMADQLYFNFPPVTDEWYKYENHFETKRATDKLELMPQEHTSLLLLGNTYLFIDKLEELTGITGLIPDPRFRGGGLHQIMPGGKLDIHADFNWHTHLQLDRRLNVLLYLNKGYKPEYAGQLELWDKEMSKCVHSIEPLFNRLVIFETTDTAFHGHPSPWNSIVSRRSMAWYFYSNGRPASEKSLAHSTKFQRRPGDETTPEIEQLRAERNEASVKYSA